MIIDEEIKFFSAPGKIRLKPIPRSSRNYLCQNQLVINPYNYFIILFIDFRIR